MAQEVEHILGKDEVTSSSLVSSSTKKHTASGVFFYCVQSFCTQLHNFFEIVRGACRLRSAIANTSCSHRLLLPSAAHLISFIHDEKVVFFLICAKFVCTNLCDLFQKSHVEPVVCARRLRILRALIAFSCRQQLYGLFCHRSLSAAVLFVLVF